MNTNKVVAAALILLTALLLFAIVNRIYIENVTATLLAKLDSLSEFSDTSEDSISEIVDYWEHSSVIIELTSAKSVIIKIEELLDFLQLSLLNGDELEYNKAMAQLKRAIADIGNREKISYENIFSRSPHIR